MEKNSDLHVLPEYQEELSPSWQCPNPKCKTINRDFRQMIICQKCGVHVHLQKIYDNFCIFIPYLWCPTCNLFTPSTDFCGKCDTKCFPNPKQAEQIINFLET